MIVYVLVFGICLQGDDCVLETQARFDTYSDCMAAAGFMDAITPVNEVDTIECDVEIQD